MTDLLVTGAGLVLAIAGTVGILSGRRLVRHGQRVTGTVESIQREPGGDGPTYRPVLAFRTLDGQDVRALARTSGRPRPGQRVPVLYDPRHPATAEIDTRAGRGDFLLLIVTGAGVCVTAYGVFTLLAG